MEHYRSLNTYLKERFGEKVYKLALDGGFTCPTRDGTKDSRGCIFCLGGSGDFSIPVGENVEEAIETAKAVVADKGAGKYIAYFQSYTGTYAPIGKLRSLYTQTIRHPDIAAVSIATRPDCLGEDVIRLLAELMEVKPVWIELGLQTIHPDTAVYIRRGYALSAYDQAVKLLRARGIETIVHMILGLPGETPEMMVQTARYIGDSGVQGIKLQLLHVLKGTDLEKDYCAGKFEVLTLEDYIAVLEECIRNLPPDMVIHRLTGDGAKRSLVAPLWSADKKRVLHAINQAFERDGLVQGSKYHTAADEFTVKAPLAQ
jgi:radical SAM protein (TIGR01212 family)